MDCNVLEIAMGYAQIAATASLLTYAETVRCMLPSERKNECMDSFKELSSFYNDLSNAFKVKGGE